MSEETSKSLSRSWRNRIVAGTAIAGMLVAGGALPAAHAATSHAGTSITLWAPYSGPDRDAFISLVSGFNSSQSAVQVNYDQQSFTSYAQKLTTALSAGKGPDMWVTDNTGMTTFAEQGVLQPLEKSVKSFKTLTASNYATNLYNGGKYNGHLYALPLDVLPTTLYYNKALFRKAGLNPNKPPVQDLKTFLAAAKKMTKGGHYGFLVSPIWPQPFIYQSVIAQFGGKVFDVKSQKAVVNSKAGVQALKVMRDMIFTQKISPANAAIDQDIKMMGNGTVGMILDGPWQYTNPALTALGSNLGYAVMPKWGSKKAVFLGTHYLVTYSKGATAAKTKAALQFASYFETHSVAMAKAGDTPAYKPVFKTKAFKALKFQKVLSSSVKYGVLSPNFPRYRDNFLYDAITSVLTGKTQDIKGALTTAADKMTQAAKGSG